MLAERDGLKDKNDKLKDMCKKYLAKLKQQDATLKVQYKFSPYDPEGNRKNKEWKGGKGIYKKKGITQRIKDFFQIKGKTPK